MNRAREGWPRDLVVSLVLGGLFARTLYTMHGYRFAATAGELHRVLDGAPYSIALSSRLLTPALVLIVSKGTGLDWVGAYYVVFVALAVVAMPLVTLTVGRYLRSPRAGLGYALATAALALFAQDAAWLHLWDLLDLSLATLFAYAAFAGLGTGALLVLFAVSLANRESALFIPSWLVISALPTQGRPRDTRRLLAGGLALAAGLAAVHAVRHAVYHGDPAPYRQMTPWGNHWKLRHNVVDLVTAIVHGYWRALTIYAGLATGAIFVARTHGRLPAHVARAPLLVAMMAASIFAFAVVQETRTWLVVVPWLVFLHAATRCADVAE